MIDKLSVMLILWIGIAEIWQHAEITLYGYTQEGITDAICALLLAFFIVKDIGRRN